MFPELLKIPALGPLHEPVVLHTYGVLIATGFILATQIMAREARRLNEPDPDRYVDLAFRFLLVGLLGARILFLIVNWRDYVRHPGEILYFWRGGLVFYGGFVLALLYALQWARHHGVSFLRLADFYIPMVAFNLAWGRLGCLAAGCCYGAPSRAPWAIRFPPGSATQATQYAQGLIAISDHPLPVHPTQIYEALGMNLVFIFLLWLKPRKSFHGQLLLVWVLLYALLRSAIEVLRGDAERGFVIKDWLSTSQFLSLLLALAAATTWFFLRTHSLLPASRSSRWST